MWAANEWDVGFVVTSLGEGGTEAYVEDLASAFSTRGLRVWVLVQGPPLIRERRLSETGVAVSVLGRGDGDSSESYGRALSAFIEAHRPAIVHANVWSRLEETRAVVNRSGIPFISTAHQTVRRPSLRERCCLLRSPFSYYRDRRAYRSSQHAIISISEKSCANLIARYGRPDRTRVVYGAVKACPVQADAGEPSSTTRLIWVGSMISRKRPNFAIDVLDRLRALGNRVSLTMVGNGPQLGFVREEAARREPGVIEAPGYLDRFAGGSPTVFEYLAVSHILIHTSTDEGVPRGVIEAMSAGLPVVACAAGAMDEAVIDGVTGHVVGTSDIDKFVAATETLVCDPGKRRRFGDAGRKFCSERFSLDNMVDQTLEAYESLCGVRIHLSHSVHEVGAGVRGLGSAYTRDSNR